MQLLQAQVDSEIWMAYVDYMDELIVDGLFATVQCSLKFLLDNTIPRPEPASLFEAVLELQVMLFRRILIRLCIFVKFLWLTCNCVLIDQILNVNGILDLTFPVLELV